MTTSHDEDKPLPEPGRISRKKKEPEQVIPSSSLSEDQDEVDVTLSNRVNKKKEYDFNEDDDEQESLEQLSYQSTKKKRDSAEVVRDVEDELPLHEITPKLSGGKKKKEPAAKSSDEIVSDEGSARSAKSKKKDNFSYEDHVEVPVRSSARKKREESAVPSVPDAVPSLVDAVPGVNEFDEEEDVPLVTKTTRGKFMYQVYFEHKKSQTLKYIFI